MSVCRARCAKLGIEAAPVQLQLFSTMVDSALSHGAEVWGMQLAAKAAASPTGTAHSKAEQLQVRYLRQLLGVRTSTPAAVVLVEAGEQPLWLRWLRRAAKLWNSMLEAPPDSLLRRTLVASCQLAALAATPARQSWAAQFAAAMASVGQPVSLLEPAPVSLPQLLEAGQERQLTQLLAAAAVEGASKLQYYVRQVGGLGLVPAAMGRRQAYLEDARLRLRQRWEALAQLRTGSHWLAEETGRWLRPPQP